MTEENNYRKGKYLWIGILIGVSVGVAIGLGMGNAAMGAAIAFPFGVFLGILIDQKFNPNPVPLTEEQKKKSKLMTIIFSVVGFLLFSALIVIYYLSL